MIGAILTLFFASIALFMYLRQNQSGRLGGPIAKAKGFWLSYTIYSWFLLLPYVLLFKTPTPFYRDAFLFLTVSMWVRGMIELYMLFVTKNWTPPIGVSHDLLTIAGLIIFPLYRNEFPRLHDAWFVFYCSLLLSLMVETYYAYAFFCLMRERTKGKDGIWYASEEDPIFRRILRITTFFNFILYAILIYFVVSAV